MKMRTLITSSSFLDQILNRLEHLSQVPSPRPAAWYWALGGLLEPRFRELGYGGQKAETLAAKFSGLPLWAIRKAVRLRRYYGYHKCTFVMSIRVSKAL